MARTGIVAPLVESINLPVTGCSCIASVCQHAMCWHIPIMPYGEMPYITDMEQPQCGRSYGLVQVRDRFGAGVSGRRARLGVVT